MKRRLVRTALVPCVAATLLGGCKMGPDYQRPALDVPESYRFATIQTAESLADLPWWEMFKDPHLQELIRTALVNNYDLRQAIARVEQARNLAIVAKAPLYPQVNYGGDIGRGRNALFNTPTFVDGATETSVLLDLSVAWEIDLWGRVRRLSEAALADYLASEEASRAVTIVLVSDVATAYYQLLDLDREIEIQRAAARDYERTLKMFTDRLEHGVASKLETERAAAALATANSVIPALQTQVALTESLLNVLLARNAGPIERGSLAEVPLAPPEIPVGLPSDLLQRRPDVLASEQQLVAANADIGANLANFYPRIGLTTFLGKASPDLDSFTLGATNMWNIGASLAGPIFQGGQIRAEYRAALARFDEAAAAYKQTVLTAFREVSDSLVTRQKLVEIRVYDSQAVTSLESSVSLAIERYLNGKSSYFEVLQAQQDLYPSQRAEVQAHVAEYIAVIQLYKALGGGWSPDSSESPESSQP